MAAAAARTEVRTAEIGSPHLQRAGVDDAHFAMGAAGWACGPNYTNAWLGRRLAAKENPGRQADEKLIVGARLLR
jgi:hypothetical protein